MGSGHSHNTSHQNSSIAFHPTVSGHGNVSVHDIISGANHNGQSASSTGATVGVKADVSVPAGLQDLHTFHLHIGGLQDLQSIPIEALDHLQDLHTFHLHLGGLWTQSFKIFHTKIDYT